MSDTPRTDADAEWCDVGSGEQEELCLASTARQLERELNEATEFRPMETAPRDGTPIDIWHDGERFPDCYYGRINPKTGEGHWILKERKDGSFIALKNVTHWRPLPKPPTP